MKEQKCTLKIKNNNYFGTKFETNPTTFIGRRLLLLSTVYLYSHALGDYMLSLVIEIILSNIFAWPYLNAPLVMNIFPYLLSYVFLSTVAVLYRIYIDW